MDLRQEEEISQLISPFCGYSFTWISLMSLLTIHTLYGQSFGRVGEKYDPCTEKHSTVYFNLPEVQKALHVNPAVAPSKWETCR